MTNQVEDDGETSFALGGTAGPAPDGESDGEPAKEPDATPRLRWRLAAGVVAAAAVLAATAGIAGATPGAPSRSLRTPVVAAPKSTATATTPTAATPTTAAATTATAAAAAAAATVPPARLAAERADLQRTAALLRTPMRLASPASWDRWLPAGKSSQGTSAQQDVATCPRIADRLGRALGQKMSWYTGTLPSGPAGCTWVDVPGQYQDARRYAYVLSVGYLADGSTIGTLRQQSLQRGGATCPSVDVPAAAPGAVLLRCEAAGPAYTLLLRDTRRPDGVWVLTAEARAHASHPAPFALTTLIGAATAAY